ncbi:MAG: exo-alpha-sialidase [Pirellulales bacterium]|nr:exo-alpha-sialidase [Pirellulales bacterium]
MAQGDGHQTSEAASWHCSELSMVLSEDDGKTWTKPVVIARTKSKRGMAYPDVFERRPGEIWVTTRYPTEPRVRISLKEVDFVGK